MVQGGEALLDKSVFDISGRVAVVTGGSRGLGRAFFEILARYAADVACVGRDARALEETAQLVTQHGRRALPLSVDVTSADSVQNMAADTVQAFGQIDILVANGGVRPEWGVAQPQLLQAGGTALLLDRPSPDRQRQVPRGRVQAEAGARCTSRCASARTDLAPDPSKSPLSASSPRPPSISS
jgi:NAD(P)-dependent dehydrogenase (short-subunit alcohol dehydrogenase family)